MEGTVDIRGAAGILRAFGDITGSRGVGVEVRYTGGRRIKEVGAGAAGREAGHAGRKRCNSFTSHFHNILPIRKRQNDNTDGDASRGCNHELLCNVLRDEHYHIAGCCAVGANRVKTNIGR